ncbi:MAG: Ppx/GppA family phosphatase [Myxococcales bacterium]|nr:Ppx/GppA family phosphatase [Myxococcales bacterium]
MTTSPWRAVIDIGTNSVLLLIARRGRDGALEVALDQSTITRLGEGVAASGVLKAEAIDRTIACLEGYRKTAAERGATIVPVTTEGVRLARNRHAFLDPAEAVLGTPVRLLSGAEEAELSYLSVARETPGGGPLRVIDIGGASTELVVGEGEELVAAVSHPIGAVRLTEQFVSADPPTPAMVAAIHAHALAVFEQHMPISPHPVLHGLAGTVTTAAALMLGLTEYDRLKVDGSSFSVAQVTELRDALASETQAQRCRRPSLEPKRADVVVAGLTILVAALEHCGAETLIVRDRGLRYALA